MLKSASPKPNYGSRNRCLALAVMIGLWCLHCLFHFSSKTTPPNHIHHHQDRQQFSYPSSSSLTFSTASASKHRISRSSSNLQQLPHAKYPATSLPHDDDDNDDCHGKYVYVHKLPPAFNQDLLARCQDLSPWTDMCKVLSNYGLGSKLHRHDQKGPSEPHINAPIVSENGWFATNQFALDVIFHNRMKQYRCLTQDSSKATLVYVPFYAGLDVSRNLWGTNVSARDALPHALARWLQGQPEWAASGGGRNHFMVCGRMTWDFRRLTQEEADWGNNLLLLPAVRNMSTLLIEKSPWHSNDYAIPYPTYFHPSSDADVVAWQDRMRALPRPSLFSFAGAPREEREDSIRGEIIQQCKQSSSCSLLECDRGASKCHSPLSVMRLFEGSVFCLQPQGDSYTRRSLFDSMVAGCIPVLFNPHSAYSQYVWHLPRSHSAYSVFIRDEDVKKKKVVIEHVLRSIPPQQVKRLREQVISLIPRLIYADPRSQLLEMKDAFDVTVEALIEKVANGRFHPSNEEEEGAAMM